MAPNAYGAEVGGKRELVGAIHQHMRVVEEEERIYGKRDRTYVRRAVTLLERDTMEFVEKQKHHVQAMNHMSGEIKQIVTEIKSNNDFVQNPKRRKVLDENAPAKIQKQLDLVMEDVYSQFVGFFGDNAESLGRVIAARAGEAKMEVPETGFHQMTRRISPSSWVLI